MYHFLMGLSPRQETPSPRAAPAAKELLAAKVSMSELQCNAVQMLFHAPVCWPGALIATLMGNTVSDDCTCHQSFNSWLPVLKQAQEVLGGRAKSAWYFDRYSVDSDKGDRQQQETVEEGHEEEEEEGQEHHHQQQQQNQQQNQQQQQQPQDTATDKLSVPLQQPPDQQPDVDAFVLFSTRPRLLPSWR